MIAVAEKECRTCKEVKPITEFYAHGPKRQGRETQCKRCKNVVVKRCREAETAEDTKLRLAHQRARDRRHKEERTPEEIQRRRAYDAEWKRKHRAQQTPEERERCLIERRIYYKQLSPLAKEHYRSHSKMKSRERYAEDSEGECRRHYQATRRRQATKQGQIARMVKSMRRRAKQCGKDCDITKDAIVRMWEQQQGCCALTGLPFYIGTGQGKGHAHPYVASIDRVDSSKGYTEDNVRLVLWAINSALMQWGEEIVLPIMQAWIEQTSRCNT